MLFTSKDFKSEEGLTLVELIIVVVILSLLVAALGWKFIGSVNPSKNKIAQIAIADIGGTLDLYNVIVGSYPDEGIGLEALVAGSGAPDNAEFQTLKKMPIDPWGKPYVYHYPGSHGLDYDLCSNGADGTEDSEDDICNWK